MKDAHDSADSSFEVEKRALYDLLWQEGGDLLATDRAWHEQQIEAGRTDEVKLRFYIWASDERKKIVDRAPKDKQQQVFDQVNHILDEHAGSRRESVKMKALQDMKRAIDQFSDTQKIVKSKTQRLKNLPSGFENRIWKRFIARFEDETSGDYLDLKLMENFRKSVDTTFEHLASTLEAQEALKSKINREKYYLLADEKGNSSEYERLAAILETRITDWLDRKVSLRDWNHEFNQLLEKQTPKNLKTFNENYSQVFTTEFWKVKDKFNPMELPNFTSSFNFQSEKSFLTRMSLSDLKKQPKVLKKALSIDLNEQLSEYFNADERKNMTAKFKAFSAKKLTDQMQLVLEVRQQKDRKRQQAQKVFRGLQRSYFSGDPRGAHAGLERLEKKYGKGVLSFLGEKKFGQLLELKMMRITELEKQLKTVPNPKRKISIQKQLQELGQAQTIVESGVSKDEKEEKKRDIESQVKTLRSQGQYEAAKSVAKQLRGLNDVKAELLVSEINREIERKESEKVVSDTKESGNSLEKAKKIEFLEKSIEHAEKVMEACAQVGIPTSDPKFWSPDGIKNRVQWLKDHGLYSMYQKFNGSDPNIPKDAQAGGFRFRWMDSRGGDLTMSRAEDGMKYIRRYKESGYILAALAGAFSINWKGMSSPTYPPDRYITLLNAEITKIKGE